MFHAVTNINWISVLLAFAAYFILGALWFTVFFSKPYRTSLGKENDQQKNVAPVFIIGPACCCLIITSTSAMLMHWLQIDSIENALQFALLVGVGYLVANTVNIAINPNIPRPLYYSFISGTYHLVGIVIVTVILAVMK